MPRLEKAIGESAHHEAHEEHEETLGEFSARIADPRRCDFPS